MWKDLNNLKIPININHFITACNLIDKDPEANEILNNFMEREDSYSIVIEILKSQYTITAKYFSLITFKKFCKLNWNILNNNDKIFYRDFFLKLLEEYVIKEEELNFLIMKINEILIEILKWDWPHFWIQFFNEFINISSKPEYIENILKFITILIQDITEFAESSLTTTRAAQMLDAFNNEIDLIYKIIESIFNENSSEKMIITGINCIKSLFHISQIDFIIQSNIFANLFQNYLSNPIFIPHIVSILNEISPHLCNFYGLNSIIIQMFSLIINSYSNYFLIKDYSTLNEESLNNLFYPLTIFISQFSNLIETEDLIEPYTESLRWIFDIMRNGSLELFRTCVDMWLIICRRIFCEFISQKLSYFSLYEEAFQELRNILLIRMERPTEFIIYIDDYGSIQRSNVITENIASYHVARELLIYLTNIDKNQMVQTILNFISILENQEFNIDLLNSLCWSVGSIQSTFTDIEEKSFISKILSYLLSLIEQQTDTVIVSILAGNIMYVCSQYTRFLNSYPELLFVVIQKLLEFAHEPIESLQESAFSSLHIIVFQCRDILCRNFNNEPSFLKQVLSNLSNILNDLTFENTIDMYEIICLMIQGLHNDSISI